MAFLVSSACVFMVQIRLTCPTPLTWPRRGGCTFQGLATSPAPRGKAHWMFRAKHQEDGTEFFHSTNTSQGQRLPGPRGILCVAALRTINEWTCSQVDAGPADSRGPLESPDTVPIGDHWCDTHPLPLCSHHAVRLPSTQTRPVAQQLCRSACDGLLGKQRGLCRVGPLEKVC